MILQRATKLYLYKNKIGDAQKAELQRVKNASLTIEF